MSDLKAKVTWVLRKMKIISKDRKPWTEHESTRYLFTQTLFFYPILFRCVNL